jgi:hypothetical protein
MPVPDQTQEDENYRPNRPMYIRAKDGALYELMSDGSRLYWQHLTEEEPDRALPIEP